MLAFVNPYREMKNRWVNVEHYNGGLAQIRAQVRSLNVKWDVVDIEIADAIRACEEGCWKKSITLSLEGQRSTISIRKPFKIVPSVKIFMRR